MNEKYNWEKEFSKEVLEILYEYDWPGNVRELKNIVERVFIMSSENKMTLDDLPKNIISRNEHRRLILKDDIVPLKDAVAKVEMELLNKAFEKYGNVREAGKALGIDASTFVRKRRKYTKIH
ncbi:MAG: hypothetical protein N4A64_12760 [Marinisporobacter sp.]|nr:hypothetical protein [Marinisporobacter sp.]